VQLQLEAMGSTQNRPGRYGEEINLLCKIVISVVICILLKRDIFRNIIVSKKRDIA